MAVTIAVVVGVMLAGWRRLGDMGGWVPMTALVVIMSGTDDPARLAAGNALLALTGAVIGVVVLIALPPGPRGDVLRVLSELRATLADKLSVLATRLHQDPLPTAAEWNRYLPVLTESLWSARSEVHALSQAGRWNWRWRMLLPEIADAQQQLATLERVAVLIDDIALTISDRERDDRGRTSAPRLGKEVDELAVEVLKTLEQVLRADRHALRGGRELVNAADSIDRLAVRIDVDLEESGHSAAAVVTLGVRRIVDIMDS